MHRTLYPLNKVKLEKSDTKDGGYYRKDKNDIRLDRNFGHIAYTYAEDRNVEPRTSFTRAPTKAWAPRQHNMQDEEEEDPSDLLALPLLVDLASYTANKVRDDWSFEGSTDPTFGFEDLVAYWPEPNILETALLNYNCGSMCNNTPKQQSMKD